MPPADGIGSEWQPPNTRRPVERSADARRLENALDRISAALVRRAERDALAAEDARLAAVPGGVPPLDHETVDELRRRLDDIIGRVRSLLGGAAL